MSDEGASMQARLRTARLIEAHHEAIYDAQAELATTLHALRPEVDSAELAEFSRAYATFDNEIERIKDALDQLHTLLTRGPRPS